MNLFIFIYKDQLLRGFVVTCLMITLEKGLKSLNFDDFPQRGSKSQTHRQSQLIFILYRIEPFNSNMILQVMTQPFMHTYYTFPPWLLTFVIQQKT